MDDIIKEYSSPVVLVLMVATLAASKFVARKLVGGVIDEAFEARKKETEFMLGRQSALKDKILTDRYLAITGTMASLEHIATNLNRRRKGAPVPDGFLRGEEVVPLTTVFENLEIHRVVLGDRYYQSFQQLAKITLRLADAKELSEWNELITERDDVRATLRGMADEDFAISATTLGS